MRVAGRVDDDTVLLGKVFAGKRLQEVKSSLAGKTIEMGGVKYVVDDIELGSDDTGKRMGDWTFKLTCADESAVSVGTSHLASAEDGDTKVSVSGPKVKKARLVA